MPDGRHQAYVSILVVLFVHIFQKDTDTCFLISLQSFLNPLFYSRCSSLKYRIGCEGNTPGKDQCTSAFLQMMWLFPISCGELHRC